MRVNILGILGPVPQRGLAFLLRAYGHLHEDSLFIIFLLETALVKAHDFHGLINLFLGREICSNASLEGPGYGYDIRHALLELLELLRETQGLVRELQDFLTASALAYSPHSCSDEDRKVGNDQQPRNGLVVAVKRVRGDQESHEVGEKNLV